MSGDMRELRHLCGHSQPDFGEWVGVAPSMSLKMTYFLQSSTLWQFATLLGPGKRTPPSPPKKSFFLSFPKETWHLVGSVFRGEPKWKISGVWMGFKGHRWCNSVSRYCNAIVKVFFNIFLSKYVIFVKICWKMRFLSFLSIKFCPQWVFKHSVVHLQGIAMNLFEDLTAI